MTKHSPLIVGKWKMNGTLSTLTSLTSDIFINSLNISGNLVLCPPYVFLPFVKKLLGKSTIQLGAQNCSDNLSGAFTGEVSAPMLKNIGCSFVILGHSERREKFHETSNMVRKKVVLALQNSLTAIICVGENIEEYKNEKTKDVLLEQITSSLPMNWDGERIVVAYEPIWAIGTGKTPTLEEVQKIHKFLKKCLLDFYGKKAQNIQVIYGGSVNEKNASDFLNLVNVDGVLVGGASLKAKSFLDIVRSVS